MKTITSWIAAAIFVLSLGSAHAQTTPVYGVKLNDPSGYTRWRQKKIDKEVAKKLKNKGQQVADWFRQNMTDLSDFSRLVDMTAREVHSEFGACFNVRGITLSNITVTIESEPFNVPGYPLTVFASGTVNRQGQMRIVWWHLSSRVGPQMALALFEGELRNLYWLWLTNTVREMWGQAVCGN